MYEPRKGPPRRVRLLLATFAVVSLGALALASSAAAAVPGNFWGVVPQVTPNAEELQRLKRGGVDSIRVPVSWGSIQPTRNGGYDWSSPDAYVAAATAAHIEVFPFLSSAPAWAVPTDRRFGSPEFLPVRNAKQRSGWKQFVSQAIQRYKPNGTFWRENPELPRQAIHLWQVWNEPNFKYFVAQPNPAEYGQLVKLTYSAARAADPQAKLILGGLFARPIEATFHVRPRQAYFASTFLQQMYASTPGIKSKFAGYALHPYTGSYKNLPSRIEEVRRVLKSNGDAAKDLYITELGWSSEPPRQGNSFAKGVGGQARELKGAFSLLRANQSRWHLQRVFWFSIGDYAGLCNFCGGSGLFGNRFKPKPAWYAYVKFAGGRP
jgi:polysaccharide biosynthesis protein PslG